MKNGPLFLLGLFVALTLSWAGLVLGSNAQLGALGPYYDESDNQAYPQGVAGLASRGQLVYADLGCAACHTQQVRRPDFGSDQARGWGDRQSVARDYIFQARPQVGASRFGPDLTNLAARKPPYDAEDLMKLLYIGSAIHPAYKFLFDERVLSEGRKVVGQVSSRALKLTGSSGAAAGAEIVPSERAQTLVAYLLSLNNAYDYPEARPVVNPAVPAHATPPEKHEEKGVPITSHVEDAKAAKEKQAEKEKAKSAVPAPGAKKAEGEKK